ncbi:peptidase T4 [Actinomyces bowdenii]|uniref:Peptidase T4 n=1 Tax=Actinomyces bowdenii TaxID=131109 RepID=A0A3P1UXT1_9ACTO|nr:peptidase T4 [Actinomyces bowdenii]RRD26126.1 peptidase T4 [Actinomyces bowdenii]
MEFIGWSACLLIPVLYLLVALSQIQAASFAVASAADIASRILEVDHSPQALAHARTAAGLALSDQGVEADPATAVSVSCEGACTGTVVLRVEAAVDLPGLAAIGLGRDVVVLEAQRAVDLSAKEEQ